MAFLSQSIFLLMRLNQFIAHTGLCSRRQAEVYIQSGAIRVNGVVVQTLSTQVAPQDSVTYKNRLLHRQKKVYALLNKPKNTITTLDDPQGRKTVMDCVQAIKVRVYPVGRLDRNTTGLLLLTNDGVLAKSLSHPYKKVAKHYCVTLDKPINKADLKTIQQGVHLEDGIIQVDRIKPMTVDHTRLWVQLHSGRNRIIRRMFGKLRYDISALDRIGYAHLTKKGLARGQWRWLTSTEIQALLRYT